MKKSILLGIGVLFALCLCFCLPTNASAAEESLPITLAPRTPALTDGKETGTAMVTKLTLTAEEAVDSLYLLFYDTPTNFTLTSGETQKTVECQYLRTFVDVKEILGEGQKEITVEFSASVRLLEIYAFAGEAPSWVQKWQAPHEKADLCLMTTHADDEQLFFAGILPYYAGEKDYAVQVIYFTDHKNEPLRRHELLNGLWTVGVDHYPVISEFPDLYSTTEKQAQTQLEGRGFTREDVVAFQVEMLRRFKPIVVIGHDPKGEYGHGQHMLNSSTLQEAVNLSADEANFPESAEKYGVWDVPKTYLHLYSEGKITMNWDIPLESFQGKTAFQVTQEGFLCHDSQQYTWFRRWIQGNNGEITAASQITTHSPCEFGLYRSTVGEDVEKNDFFENVKTWEQQRLEEEERLRQEEEKRRLEEEKKREEEKKEEERIRKSKLARAEAEKNQAAKEKQEVIIYASVAAGLVLLIGLIVWVRRWY